MLPALLRNMHFDGLSICKTYTHVPCVNFLLSAGYGQFFIPLDACAELLLVGTLINVQRQRPNKSTNFSWLLRQLQGTLMSQCYHILLYLPVHVCSVPLMLK